MHIALMGKVAHAAHNVDAHAKFGLQPGRLNAQRVVGDCPTGFETASTPHQERTSPCFPSQQ
jgi:hypothetical protein